MPSLWAAQRRCCPLTQPWPDMATLQARKTTAFPEDWRQSEKAASRNNWRPWQLLTRLSALLPIFLDKLLPSSHLLTFGLWKSQLVFKWLDSLVSDLGGHIKDSREAVLVHPSPGWIVWLIPSLQLRVLSHHNSPWRLVWEDISVRQRLLSCFVPLSSSISFWNTAQ